MTDKTKFHNEGEVRMRVRCCFRAGRNLAETQVRVGDVTGHHKPHVIAFVADVFAECLADPDMIEQRRAANRNPFA